MMERVKKCEFQKGGMANGKIIALVALVLVFGMFAGCTQPNAAGGNEGKAEFGTKNKTAPQTVIETPVKKTEAPKEVVKPIAEEKKNETAAAANATSKNATQNATGAVEENNLAYEIKFSSSYLGELSEIKMGERGTMSLKPLEGNVFRAYRISMENSGSLDKKAYITKLMAVVGGKNYGYSYSKTHEATLSSFIPFECKFGMEEASDAGFSAKVRFGSSRSACVIFETPKEATTQIVLDASVSDSAGSGRGHIVLMSGSP